MELPSIAVVCATYNGEEKLFGLTEALKLNLENSIVNSEIIFIIDGSTDGSVAHLQNFANLYSDKIIKIIENSSNLGISESRNIGIAASHSEIIAFLDDDCRPNPNWLNSLAEQWCRTSKETIGIGGFVIPNEKKSFNQEFCAMVMPLRPMPLSFRKLNIIQRIKKYYATLTKSTECAEYLVGANMSFRRGALFEVGLFSSSMRFGGDDSDICKMLRNRYGNNCLRILPNLEMRHEFSRSFKDSVRRSFRYGLGAGKNFCYNKGGFSFNPGPVLILGLFLLFLNATTTLSDSTHKIFFVSFLFILLEIFFYTLLVNRKNEVQSDSSLQRIKFGLAFLTCEAANTLGFFSGLRFMFSNSRKFL